eukprot:1176657-Prorocentrum_minimum.AAC.1
MLDNLPTPGLACDAITTDACFVEGDVGYDGRLSRLSGGFGGLMMSLAMCGTVDIYGFSQGSAHYFEKEAGAKLNPKSSPKPWYKKHYFSVERHGAPPPPPDPLLTPNGPLAVPQ